MFKWWEPIFALVLVALFFAAPKVEWKCPFEKSTTGLILPDRHLAPPHLTTGMCPAMVDKEALTELERAYDDPRMSPVTIVTHLNYGTGYFDYVRGNCIVAPDNLVEVRAKRRYYPRGRLTTGLSYDAIDEKGLAWLEAAYEDDQGQTARERLRKGEH